MPLRLMQRLQKLVHAEKAQRVEPSTSPNAPSQQSNQEGQWISSGTLRSPTIVQKTKSARSLKNHVNQADSLSSDLARLTLEQQKATEPLGQEGSPPSLHESDQSSGAEPLPCAANPHEQQRWYSSPVSLASPGDPYGEAVADRNSRHPPGATDIDTRTRQLVPVVHEKRTVKTHEIVEQPTVKEIHNHHVLHRRLPIKEVEVLPPRHFVPSKSRESLIEIRADATPAGSRGDGEIQQTVKEVLSGKKHEARSAGAS